MRDVFEAIKADRRSLAWIAAGTALYLVLLAAAANFAAVLFGLLSGQYQMTSISPIAFIWAWRTYGDTHSGLLTITTIAVLLLISPLLVLPFFVGVRNPFGNARWATWPEIRAMNLLSAGAGIVVARKRGKYLVFKGAGQGKHVSVIAPSGSGKTQGIMIPNLLSWPGSVVALDIKGECFDRTAGYRRAKGQRIVKLNFLARDFRTDCYDPFEYLSSDPNFRVTELEQLARYFVPDDHKTEKIWTSGARKVFITAAMYLYETGDKCTLGAVYDVITTPMGFQRFASDTLAAAQRGELELSPGLKQDLGTLASTPDKTFGGFLSQLATSIDVLRNPLTRMATSKNTFDLRRIRSEPTSIYITIERPDLPVVRSLVAVFFQQLVDLNMRTEYGKNPTHCAEVLLAMDELMQMGRVDGVIGAAPILRSYGFRILGIYQDRAQTVDLYGEHQAQVFENSMDCSVFFTPAARDTRTPEDLSKLLGTRTINVRSRSSRLFGGPKDLSETQSQTRRPLMLPHEISQMSQDKAIVLISGKRPIMANKIRAWQERAFGLRNGEPPEIAPLKRSDWQVSEIEDDAIGTSSISDLTHPLTTAEIPSRTDWKPEDFALDFSQCEIPKGQLNEQQVSALHDAFLDMLNEANKAKRHTKE